MATLDRCFARKAKETSDSFNKGSGTARNHASSDDKDWDSILSSDYNSDEAGDWVSSNSENNDEKLCSPSASKGYKSTTVEQDGGAPSRGTCESREKFCSKWLSELIN